MCSRVQDILLGTAVFCDQIPRGIIPGGEEPSAPPPPPYETLVYVSIVHVAYPQ